VFRRDPFCTKKSGLKNPRARHDAELSLVNIAGDKITGAHTEHFRNAFCIKRRFEEQIQLVANAIMRRVRCPVHSLHLCAEGTKLFARTESWESVIADSPQALIPTTIAKAKAHRISLRILISVE
jgi:hypothetical protein